MNLQDILSILTLLGIGAFLPKLLEYFTDKQRTREQTKHDFKQTRYKAILLLMYSSLDFDKRNKSLLKHNRDFKNKEDLIDELITEWTNMTLYASDNVVLSMKRFLQTPTEDAYIDTTLAMRKDLYNIKTRLKIDDLKMN